MKYLKDSNEWLLIRGNTNHWFSQSTLDFFKSKIYWNTLVKHGEEFYFITSEDNFDSTKKVFSIRRVTADYDIQTPQEFDTLQEAKQQLKIEVNA